MNIADVFKLSVGGYTKEQIKEMWTMTKDCPEILDYAIKNGKSFDDVKGLFDFSQELGQGETVTPTPPQEQTHDSGKSDRDAELEKKIEELTKQNEELNKSISTLQSQNLHTDQGGNQPDPSEEFNKIVASFM